MYEQLFQPAHPVRAISTLSTSLSWQEFEHKKRNLLNIDLMTLHSVSAPSKNKSQSKAPNPKYNRANFYQLGPIHLHPDPPGENPRSPSSVGSSSLKASTTARPLA